MQCGRTDKIGDEEEGLRMWVTSSTGPRTVHPEYSRHNLSRHREGDHLLGCQRGQ